MLARFVRSSFQKHPVLSNSVSYTSLLLAAEVSQQFVTKRVLPDGPPEPLDFSTLGRYAVYGSCVGSQILYFWYRWLDKNYVGTAAKIVTKKIILDQFVMTPALLVAFYTTMSALEQREDRGLFDELKEKFVPTFKISCLFWLPVQTVNFVLIPPVGRVVYVGFASLAWANILCWIKRQPSQKEQALTTA